MTLIKLEARELGSGCAQAPSSNDSGSSTPDTISGQQSLSHRHQTSPPADITPGSSSKAQSLDMSRTPPYSNEKDPEDLPNPIDTPHTPGKMSTLNSHYLHSRLQLRPTLDPSTYQTLHTTYLQALNTWNEDLTDHCSPLTALFINELNSREKDEMALLLFRLTHPSPTNSLTSIRTLSHTHTTPFIPPELTERALNSLPLYVGRIFFVPPSTAQLLAHLASAYPAMERVGAILAALWEILETKQRRQKHQNEYWPLTNPTQVGLEDLDELVQILSEKREGRGFWGRIEESGWEWVWKKKAWRMLWAHGMGEEGPGAEERGRKLVRELVLGNGIGERWERMKGRGAEMGREIEIVVVEEGEEVGRVWVKVEGKRGRAEASEGESDEEGRKEETAWILRKYRKVMENMGVCGWRMCVPGKRRGAISE